MDEQLYREYILEHYKRPHNWGELEHPDLEAHDLNPLCGDELKVQLAIDDGRADHRVAFSGHGCAISQAAASMISDEVKGMQVQDLLRARPRGGARPARDRHLGDAHEVRDARAQGAEERLARPHGRVGARSLSASANRFSGMTPRLSRGPLRSLLLVVPWGLPRGLHQELRVGDGQRSREQESLPKAAAEIL